MEEPCDAGLVCVNTDGQPTCLGSCTPTACEYGTEAGICVGVGLGERGLCVSIGMGPSDCRPGAIGCTTEYGATADTICATDGAGLAYCLEWCIVSETGCAASETCVPDADGSGVCIQM
jgi:hypothetical protein